MNIVVTKTKLVLLAGAAVRSRGKNPMSPIKPSHAALAALLTLGAAAASAQTASAPSDETVKLNPFEVVSSPDNNYSVMNSNTLTAFKVSLANTPVTADIMDRALMDDVGATSVEGMISAFDAGSGYGGANAGNASTNQPFDHGSNPGLKIRGRPTTPQLDGLQLNNGNYGDTNFGSTTNFNLDRIEVVNGPQALLYDGVGPGGVVNEVEKTTAFNQPAFGSLSYKVDQYGTKYSTFDYGVGGSNLAARVAFVDGSTQTRRVNIADRLKGGYVQLKARAFNTTLSVSLRQTVDTRTYQNYATLTSTGDPVYAKFNNDHLEYLLATGQAGGIMNGNLNWGNAGSLAGYAYTDFGVGESMLVKADSQWTSWLSSSVQAGLGNFDSLQSGYSDTLNFYSPNATANPSPGHWTMSFPSSGFPMEGSWRPHVGKAARAILLATNDLFGGKVKSQTMFDVDTAAETASLPIYRYYQADSSGNVLRNNPATTSDFGRTTLPTLTWNVDNGPVLYNFFNPDQQQINYQGTPYAWQIQNINGQGRSYYYQKGMALVNYTTWLDGKLDTMIGARNNIQNGVVNGQSATPYDKPDFMVGAVYHITPWLSPYLNVSDLWLTNNAQQPDGSYSPNNHDVGEETGFKLNLPDDRLSGSVSVFHSADSNENFNGDPGITGDVSPNGLNGQLPSGTGGQVNANAETWGATAAITAVPIRGWRNRLSATWMDGKFKSKVSYNQLYNDQFYENSTGQVTYADGSVVYVNPTFNSKQVTVAAGTAGAIPLTVQKLSTPTDPYYAAPQPVTGAVLKTSNGGLALLNGASSATGVVGHGSILTGATGLPISAYQLVPALSGVTPAGTVFAVPNGGQTFGTPKFALAFTSIYEIPEGPLKGFEFGGTVHGTWGYLNYYYYNGITTATSDSSMIHSFYYPTSVTFDPIFGWTHKFKRITFRSQVNVYNAFNHYHVIIYPNVTNGFNTVTSLTANFDVQPRVWTWTNTIKF